MKLKLYQFFKWSIFTLFLITPLLISSQLKADEETYLVSINQDDCSGCGYCIALDPYGILEYNDDGKAAFFGIYPNADVEALLYMIYQEIAEGCPGCCFSFYHY